MGALDPALRTEGEGFAPDLEFWLEAQSPRDNMGDWHLLTSLDHCSLTASKDRSSTLIVAAGWGYLDICPRSVSATGREREVQEGCQGPAAECGPWEVSG